MNKLEIYECGQTGPDKCTCLVEMLTDCDDCAAPGCCDVPMTKVEPKTADNGKEKHVPVIEKVPGGFKVKVGDVPHPMEPDHFIQFIEIRTDDEVQRKYLQPGRPAEAIFMTEAASISAVELCNKHGVWQA